MKVGVWRLREVFVLVIHLSREVKVEEEGGEGR